MKRLGSGKTKGATSFVTISLKELSTVLREEALVVVSRKFAESLFLDGKAFAATAKNHSAFGPQIKISTETLLDTH